jgi:hypothetical protein
MRLAHLLAAVLIAATPAAALAQTVIPVDRFVGVDLHGGGTVNIRQGATQRVTLVEGDRTEARFEVNSRGQLNISPCRGWCVGNRHFEVDIETPDLNSVAIYGGGHIRAQGAFPAQGAVSAAIHGGGEIDMRAVPAQSASAAIHGGGKIVIFAQNSLGAAINGGGEIRYAGRPAVSSAIHGGGSVSPIQ